MIPKGQLPPVLQGFASPTPDPNKAVIIWGWAFLVGAVVLAAIPVFNVLGLVIGGGLATAALVMAIILLARGRTGVGVAMLLSSLIGAPILMFVFFFLSNLIFAAGVAGSKEGFPKPSPPPVFKPFR